MDLSRPSTRVKKNSIQLLISLTCMMFELQYHTITSIDIRSCDVSLGMESGDIPDHAITASSSYVPNVGPRNGRLRYEKAGGAWCPKQQVESGVREYLQISLDNVHIITGVQTQGRYDHGRGQEYVEEYTIEYRRPEIDDWKEYKRWDGKQIIVGNSDTATVVSHRLMPPIFASQIRIIPYSVHRRTVCLRAELRGCSFDGGVISYEIPEPLQDFPDSSYDGEHSDGKLRKGLGQLVDGELGADNFKLDIGYGRGNGWVGWKKNATSPPYIEVIFEFDTVRNFTAINFFVNNFFTREVQVFSKAKIYFSNGGRFFNGKIIIYNYMEDKILEIARNISISLHHRIAKFVKIHLYFASKWILLSEVYFDSKPINVNKTEEIEEILSDYEIIVNSEVNNVWETFETTYKDENTFLEITIGFLTVCMLLLLLFFIIILSISRRQKFEGSPSILRNPFAINLNIKAIQDFLIKLSPNPPSNVNNQQITSANTEGPNFSTAVEEHQSPLVDMQYQAINVSAAKRCTGETASLGNLSMHEPAETILRTKNSFSTPSGTSSALRQYLSLKNLSKDSQAHMSKYMLNDKIYNPELSGSNKDFYYKTTSDTSTPQFTWNIVPSMDEAYHHYKEAELAPIPKYCLHPIEKIGSWQGGEVTLFETDGLNDIIPGVGRLVLVRTQNSDMAKNINSSPFESLREIRFLATLSDPNICRVLGICTAELPPWIVLEYGEMGDLAHYLKYSMQGTTTKSKMGNVQILSYECLISMATQIASGMKYLENRHVCHKDLAARNCLVTRDQKIKISDISMCSLLYQNDYCDVGGRDLTPVRWLPWESILLDRYCVSSSVWSFAVTLWEILNMARDRPFQQLTDEQVIQNAEYMYYGGELQVLLPKPNICPNNVYELMRECWRRDEKFRPTFKQIYIFLKYHNKNYKGNG